MLKKFKIPGADKRIPKALCFISVRLASVDYYLPHFNFGEDGEQKPVFTHCVLGVRGATRELPVDIKYSELDKIMTDFEKKRK